MKLKIIFITILITGTCVALCLTMCRKNEVENDVCTRLVVNVESIGEQNYVSDQQVANLLKAKGFSIKDKKIAEIRLDKIRETLESNLAVKKAKCYFAKNGDLKIDIVQRTPFFKVDASKSYYVDTERVIFTTSPTFTADVLVAKGNFSEKFAQNELFKFVEFVQKDNFLSALIKKIDVEKEAITLTPRIGNQIIIVGKLKDESGNLDYFKTKLERLKKFYAEGVLNKMGWEKYSEIDLRFKKQVVCR